MAASSRIAGELATRLLDLFGRLARRGVAAARADACPRRLILLQIDGLSWRQLERALARGRMPRLSRRLHAGQFLGKRLTALRAPSTPVFQAGLLHGDCEGIPGFGWYDRRLGRVVRMDSPEDVTEVQRELDRRGRGLLEGGVSYVTIFTGRALETFFNIARWGRPAPRSEPRPPRHRRNIYDALASATMALLVGGRALTPFILEVGAGARDLLRFVYRQGTTRFEWRFLVTRLVTRVILREAQTFGLILDVFRGVPVLFADYIGYDECAHRRGPESPLAHWNLRAIDEDLERVLRAVERVPEYRYDVFLFSDHGQSASVPFRRIIGEDLDCFVLAQAARAPARGPAGHRSPGATASPSERDGPAPRDGAIVHADRIRLLVRVRALRSWARRQRWIRHLAEPWLARLERRAGAQLRLATRRPLDRFRVVTGGTIAHVYIDRRRDPTPIEELQARWPALVDGLARCPAVGVMVARGRRGTVVFHRGQRYRLADRRGLSSLEPFRRLGYRVLARHLAGAVRSDRAGDLVLFGAFAPAGDVTYDFELGSHGGIHPDELEHFLLHPTSVRVPFDGATGAEELHRFFFDAYRQADRPRGDKPG